MTIKLQVKNLHKIFGGNPERAYKLLEQGYERRRAFDAKQNPECLDIAERIEGLVRFGDKTFHVVGKTKTTVFGREAWDSFTEQTLPRAGTVLFAAARGLSD